MGTQSSNNNVRASDPSAQITLEKNLRSKFGDKLQDCEAQKWKEFGLTFYVSAEDAEEVFKTLKSDPDFDFSMLVDLTAVDWLDKREPRFDVVYQLMSMKHLHRLGIKIQVTEEKPEAESVVPLWASADFMEREVWDMYGIVFNNHGDLRRILMYDEFVGHPLRKDYPITAKQPRVKLRVPELRNTSGDMSRNELVALPSRKGS